MMCCRSLFAAMRSIAGRSRRLEMMLLAQSRQLTRMEKTMSDTKAELLAEINQVKTEVTALLADKQGAIDAAVAKAKAAWDADNEAEHTEAMAALEDIRKSLADSQGQFQPSGN